VCAGAPARSRSPLFPYTTLFRSRMKPAAMAKSVHCISSWAFRSALTALSRSSARVLAITGTRASVEGEDCSCAFLQVQGYGAGRSEEHTSELQSRENLVCRLLLD